MRALRIACEDCPKRMAIFRRRVEKMANMKVVLGAIPNAGRPTVALSQPMPLNPDDPLYRALTPQYQRAYHDRPPLPSPFFIFRR